MLLEICSSNYQSAVNAQEAGAHRIELCVELTVGGITPSYGLIRKVLEKLDIPIFVLIRPRSGNFTYSTEEFEIMKDHTKIGYDILKDSPSKFLQMGAVIALGHHEKFDGTGYPYGKKGDDIPIEARIVAIADVYDALCSRRAYKEPWPEDRVLDEIEQQDGYHFDPDVVEAFWDIYDVILAIRNKYISDEVRDSRF